MAFTINSGTDSTLDTIYATDYWIVNKWFGDRLWAMGYGGYGMLGNNSSGNVSVPVQNIAGGTNWKQVAGCRGHALAVKTDGTLWGWGENNYGQVGNGSGNSYSSPIQTVAGGTNWKTVACGMFHTAAIKTDGTLWTWGYNNVYQLGDLTQINRASPVQVTNGGTNWSQVACGWYHTAAIKTDGTLWMCGYNRYGNFGNNVSTNYFSYPVQTFMSTIGWRQVACGNNFTAVVKTDGTLWLSGYNLYGMLGDNTTVDKSSPVQTIAGGTNWKQVACGYWHASAIKTDGTLWAWGRNDNGQLGDVSTTHKSSPLQTTAGGTNWKQVTCGDTNTVSIKTDGTLWSWGNNSNGQLGDNTSANSKSSPVQTFAGGTNWKQAASGSACTVAIQINNINTTGT